MHCRMFISRLIFITRIRYSTDYMVMLLYWTIYECGMMSWTKVCCSGRKNLFVALISRFAIEWFWCVDMNMYSVNVSTSKVKSNWSLAYLAANSFIMVDWPSCIKHQNTNSQLNQEINSLFVLFMQWRGWGANSEL